MLLRENAKARVIGKEILPPEKKSLNSRSTPGIPDSKKRDANRFSLQGLCRSCGTLSGSLPLNWAQAEKCLASLFFHPFPARGFTYMIGQTAGL
jgi:hypothetical protein